MRALFDEETMDYMVKSDLRMMTLTEIELITGDFEEFKRNMKLLTPRYIARELVHRENVSVLVRGKGFMVWDYSQFFPPAIGHYERIIEPSRPLLGLNGSYIIASYECREKETGILFSTMYTEMNITANSGPKAFPALFISMMPKPYRTWKRPSRPIWKRT